MRFGRFRIGPGALRLSPERGRVFPVAADKRPLAPLRRLARARAPWSRGGSAGGQTSVPESDGATGQRRQQNGGA